MIFCTQVALVPLLLTSALASEVTTVPSDVIDLTSDLANTTSEAKDDPDAGIRTYKGYKLFRVTPESEGHLQILRFIEKSVDSMWTPIPERMELERELHVDMMVNPTHAVNLRAFLECSSIPFEVCCKQNLHQELKHKRHVLLQYS